MKIAYLCNFAYPFWEGIWNNVYHLAKHMIRKGHEAHVFCSNLNPAGQSFEPYEIFEGIHIHRFPVKLKIGQYALFFDFEKELLLYSPDLIHTHGYRSPFSTKVVQLAEELAVPCILTTHAPFARERGFPLNQIVKTYDISYGKRILNKYAKVIAITHWEQPFLEKIGCKKEKIEYIPNGVDEKLFIPLAKRKPKKVLYLGRISPIKQLGWFIEAARIIPEAECLIYGPFEKGYSLSSLSKNLKICDSPYQLPKEISLFREFDVYVLPSKSEGLPQTLLEAMAAGKIVLASKTLGAQEVIKDGKNGFLFSDVRDLAKKMKYILFDLKNPISIQKNAQHFARKVTWNNVIKKTEKLYREVL